jgi:hypothetical protein
LSDHGAPVISQQSRAHEGAGPPAYAGGSVSQGGGLNIFLRAHRPVCPAQLRQEIPSRQRELALRTRGRKKLRLDIAALNVIFRA